MAILKQPPIRHLLDAPRDDWYVVEEQIVFRWNQFAYATIPEGYVTDGCSVPKALWGIFPPLGAFLVPGLIHDYLYESKEIKLEKSGEWYVYRFTRKEADDYFLQLLNLYSPLTKRRNYIRYLVVRAFGKAYWKKAKLVNLSNYRRAFP